MRLARATQLVALSLPIGAYTSPSEKVEQMTTNTGFVVGAVLVLLLAACSASNTVDEDFGAALADHGHAHSHDPTEEETEAAAVGPARPFGVAASETAGGAADGITSMDQAVGSTAYSLGLEAADIAEIADVGFDGTVINIRPGRLNTPSGLWEPKRDTPANRLHDEWALLAPYTVVEM